MGGTGSKKSGAEGPDISTDDSWLFSAPLLLLRIEAPSYRIVTRIVMKHERHYSMNRPYARKFHISTSYNQPVNCHS